MELTNGERELQDRVLRSPDIADKILHDLLMQYQYCSGGDPFGACQALYHASIIYKLRHDFSKQAEMLMVIGEELSRCGQSHYEEANKEYQEALVIARRVGDSYVIYGAAYGLGVNHQEVGNLEVGLSYFNEAIQHASKLVSEPGRTFLAEALFKRGVTYHLLENIENELKDFLEATRVSKESEDWGMCGTAALFAAKVYQYQAERKEACHYYKVTRQCGELVGNEELTEKGNQGWRNLFCDDLD